MHKIRTMIVLGFVGLLGILGSWSDAWYFDRFTQNDQKVVVTDDIDGDPFREWAANPAWWVNGLYNQGKIWSFFEAQNQTINFIQNIVNWSLSIIGLIALVYLLYNGFLMLTAAGDDAQFKKGAKAVRTTTLALVGMWVSALIVNAIFYFVDKIL